MKQSFAILAVASLLAGCVAVPTKNVQDSTQAKTFDPPAAGEARLYIYRNSSYGAALKKDVWVNGQCVGETVPKMFFVQEVEGDAEHTLSTESEFSPNHLSLRTEGGKIYFIRQYIKPGLLVGGANLEVVEEEQGKADVMSLAMGIKGKCSKPSIPLTTSP